MSEKNVLICNGGGPTAVINLTNMGLVEGCLEHSFGRAKIYAGIGGTGGLIGEHATSDGKRRVVRLDQFLADNHQRQLIKNTPSTWIGSGRYKIGAKVPEAVTGGDKQKAADYDCAKILELCDTLKVSHVFFVGGDDTLTTCNALASYQDRHQSTRSEWPTFISVPKTIDNDLPKEVDDPEPGKETFGVFKVGGKVQVIDACPGFGTAANFVANKVAHLAVEAKAMSRHYVIEVMGRDSGFLTAASLLAQQFGYGPHLIACPEHPAFNVADFKALVDYRDGAYGYGVYVVSEGIRGDDGGPLVASKATVDTFGHAQLGGVGDYLKQVCDELKADVRAIKFGELQRVATTFRSKADAEIAYRVGYRAAYWALERGETCKLVTIVRQPSEEPTWLCGLVDTHWVSKKKRFMDPQWIVTKEEGGVAVPMVADSYLDYVEPLTDPLIPIAGACSLPRVEC